MFRKKKKIELNNDELRIMRYSLNEFRNDLLKENRYVDAINEVMVKLKNKMKVDKNDLGVMINGLDKVKSIHPDIQNKSEINNLILRLLEIHETL